MSAKVIEIRPPAPQSHGNLLVEQTVLMAMLLGRIDEVRSHGVTVDDFLLTEHQVVASACFAIDQADGAHALPLVWKHLEAAGEIRKLPGTGDVERAQWLHGIIDGDIPMLSHVGELASQLRIDGARRRVHRLVSQLANAVGTSDSLEIRLQLEHAERELERMNAAGSVKPYHSIKESMTELAFDVAERAKSKSTRNGISTGYTDWDAILRGWQPGTLNVVAARPSVGKTALIVCSLLRAAQDENIPVLLFSLEQARREIAERTVCAVGRVDNDIFRRVPSSVDVSDVCRVTTRVSAWPMAICDATGISIYELCSRARRFARDAQFASKGKYRGIIGVDYIQIVKAAEARQGREREVAEVAERLKALAQSLEMPVIALAQLNRDIEKRDNSAPRLSDIRESGSIEQWADTVTMLDREELRQPKEPKFPPGSAQLYVRKNRSGAIGDCCLVFADKYTLFDDMTHREDSERNRANYGAEDRRVPRERIPGEDDEAL